MGDGFVNFLDGGLEFLAGETVVAAKGILEGVELALEIAEVDGLALGNGQLPLQVDALTRGLHEERDEGDEELGPDDVHLLVAVRLVDDAV